jgi:phosphate transport system substrate-binding protein
MHIRESYWGLGSGFQRFACGQIGQLIVEKEGLQPYYLFDKQLNIKKESIKD